MTLEVIHDHDVGSRLKEQLVVRDVATLLLSYEALPRCCFPSVCYPARIFIQV